MTSVRLPGDKSLAHRALMLAPLASGNSVIRNLPASRDVMATSRAMRLLGAVIREVERGRVRVEGGAGLHAPSRSVDCGNSGTTARLLTGLLTGLGLPAELTGDASLLRRPMARVVYPLQAMGGRIRYLDQRGRLPIRIERRASGSLRTLRHRPRVASAQVKSALLLAGLADRTAVEVIEARRSRDHTERLLGWMGVPIQTVLGAGGAQVRLEPGPGPALLRPLDLDLPGDVSSAAFLIVAALLHGRRLEISGVGLNPTRTGFLDVLCDMGARVIAETAGTTAGESWGTIRVEPAELVPFRISAETAPSVIDELPALAVLAARVDGVSEVSGAAELRVKESDRIELIIRNLSNLGVDCVGTDDGFRVRGSRQPLSGEVRTAGDHRVTMAFGVLASLPDMHLHIERPDSVAVSFPGFWQELEALVTARHPRAAGIRTTTGDQVANDQTDGPAAFTIAIDGPAASGKSTTAQRVAEEIGARHLNSGQLYRAITWAALRGGWIDDRDFGVQVERLPVSLIEGGGGFEPDIGGITPGAALSAPEVVERVSQVSASRIVRERVLETLRDTARGRRIVSDGRDIGTTVFPEAELKVFLTASPAERARRRLLDRGEAVTDQALDRETAALAARDKADSTRELSPLRRADDAVEIDTTRLTSDQVVEQVVRLARERGLDVAPY